MAQPFLEHTQQYKYDAITKGETALTLLQFSVHMCNCVVRICGSAHSAAAIHCRSQCTFIVLIIQPINQASIVRCVVIQHADADADALFDTQQVLCRAL